MRVRGLADPGRETAPGDFGPRPFNRCARQEPNNYPETTDFLCGEHARPSHGYLPHRRQRQFCATSNRHGHPDAPLLSPGPKTTQSVLQPMRWSDHRDPVFFGGLAEGIR
jgi:hypothetical protein